MEQNELQRAIEAILFAAGERIEVSRLAMALEADPKDIIAATDSLMDTLAFERRGIRILKLEGGYQMVSSGEMADFITKALETRKPPKLSASQLETLTIVAYYQPATKAMVEQIRGVDSSYSVAALLNKKLIEEWTRLRRELDSRITDEETRDLLHRLETVEMNLSDVSERAAFRAGYAVGTAMTQETAREIASMGM